MVLYNVTLILDDSIEQQWLEWMKDEHIDQVMATGKFVSNRLLKVLESPNEGVTYCAQYVAETMEDYQSYVNDFAPALQADLNKVFADKFVAFRTVMEYVI